MSSIVENPIEVVSSTPELQRIEESDMEDVLGSTALPHPSLKKLDTSDSLASNDSDISLSYDSPNPTKPQNERENDHSADNDTSDSASDCNVSSNEKDSGCEVAAEPDKKILENFDKAEDDEPPFIPPDDELANKIVAQVEFYFSDVNITKDAFLLKHVKRNKEGYVSLKLISSFKRVKHLAKDWRVVAYALQRSTKLEINEAKTKLRRVDPLPPYDQTTPSRTIVAINLPMEKPTIESVAELFRGCGEIALIRILRPGNPIPADVRSFANKHPEMNNCVSALIEFDRTESAKLAIEKQDSDWRTSMKGLKIVELNAPPSADRKKRPQAKKSTVKQLVEGEFSSSCQSSSEAEDPKLRQRRSSSPHPTRPADIPRLQRRFSTNRDSSDSGCRDYRPSSCACCNHCGERRYSSSGSGYDSPVPSSYRRFSITRDAQEPGYQIPANRRYSGTESPCCLSMRRCSRDSGSESSGSYSRQHILARRFSRDSLSGSEGGMHRRFSGDSVSSETGNFRRFSRESVNSDVFVPPFLSRSSSRDIIDLSRRSSFGSNSGCDHHPLTHSGSRSSFTIPSSCLTSCPPHMPENVVRMPKGPDGSKGFGAAQ